MSDSVWLLEYRSRERKNGKWSEWANNEGWKGVGMRNAYSEYPSREVLSHEKYERRAVEYVRATLPSNAVPAQASPFPSASVPALHNPPTT